MCFYVLPLPKIPFDLLSMTPSTLFPAHQGVRNVLNQRHITRSPKKTDDELSDAIINPSSRHILCKKAATSARIESDRTIKNVSSGRYREVCDFRIPCQSTSSMLG